jgi:hypothetical protein
VSARLLAIQAIVEWRKLTTVSVALDLRHCDDLHSPVRVAAQRAAELAGLKAAWALAVCGGSIEIDGKMYHGEVNGPGRGAIRVCYVEEEVKSEL